MLPMKVEFVLIRIGLLNDEVFTLKEHYFNIIYYLKEKLEILNIIKCLKSKLILIFNLQQF